MPSFNPGPKSFALIESIGRVAVFVLPFLLDLYVQTGFDRVLVAVGAFALLVYYAGWTRYFMRGRSPSLLFAKLGFLPVPLAISPVIYFLAFAGPARSPLMAFVVVVFGVAYVSLSLKRVGAA